jgi:hypothetical protein
MPHVWVPRHVTRLIACRRLLRLHRATGCLGTSRGSSAARRTARRRLLRLAQGRRRQLRLAQARRRLLRLRACVRVPQHVAQLVMRIVAPLVVDYSSSRRLVVDYFAYAARLITCRRLFRLRRATGCLGTSRGSSRGSLRRSSLTTLPRAGSSSTTLLRAGSPSTTSPPPRVRVPRHVARLVAGLSRGLLRRSSSTTPPRAGSSSTTSPPPRVWVPRHVARLVVDYFTYAARLGGSARRAAHHLSSTTSPTPCDRVPWHVGRLVVWLAAPLVIDYSTSHRLVVD